MVLKTILEALGFRGGVILRYNDDTQMVMFFLSHDRVNPAVTQTGSIVSVGSAPVRVHGKIADTRVRSPLNERKDFDLVDPNSLAGIESWLATMVDKYERRYRRDRA